MSANTITDLRRELEKARAALISAQTHLAAHAEANAALHLATTVMYSPLHASVTAAIGQIEHALERSTDAYDEAKRQAALLSVLTDLDRCTHGRHQGDSCVGCPEGASQGNPHMPTGTAIGYDISGHGYVMPDREHKHDPACWRDECSS